MATVNGTTLSEREFQSLCEGATQIAPQRGSVGLQVLGQWVGHTVLAQQARELKAYPTEKELEARMQAFKNQASFYGADFEGQLRQQGMTLEDLKRELFHSMVQDAVIYHGVEISDAELQQAFDRDKRRFTIPEQVEISQITLDSEAKMKQARNDLARNANFALVAQTLSRDAFAERGGKVEMPLTRDMAQSSQGLPVAPQVIAAAFKLKEGQISEPMKVGSTWVIIRLDKRIPAKEPKLEDMKELIRAGLRQERAAQSGKLQENQKRVAAAFQKAVVEIHRPEYQILKAQMQQLMNPQAAAAGAAGIPGDVPGAAIPHGEPGHVHTEQGG